MQYTDVTTNKREMLTAIGVICCLSYAIGLHYPIGFGYPEWHRVAYMICHASVWHLIGNLWCMYLIEHSNFKVTPLMVIMAFVVAACVPRTDMDTVGISGFLYALMGMMSWQAASMRSFHLLTLVFMSLGLLWPHRINNLMHIWCYAYGVLLVTPIKINGRGRQTDRREQAQS